MKPSTASYPRKPAPMASDETKFWIIAGFAACAVLTLTHGMTYNQAHYDGWLKGLCSGRGGVLIDYKCHVCKNANELKADK